jgi:hypothetical protein
MLCIGGPLHGQDIEFDGANYFWAPILGDRPFKICLDVPDYRPLRKVLYNRQRLVTRTRKIIEYWVVD